MIRETVRRIRKRLTDVVFHGRNRAMILLGTDRKDTVDSGWGDGGENDEESATIDIVVGYDATAENPDYENDKSRIYVSGKTNPDEYFAINKGDEIDGEAAIINISDNIYLKARNKIKILNENISILINDNGEIEIEASEKCTIKAGQSSIVLNSDGSVSIGTQSPQEDFAALAGRVKSELDDIRTILRTLTLPLNVGAGTAGPPSVPILPANSVAAGRVKID